MIAAIARAMPTGSNYNTVFFQTNYGGGLRKVEKIKYPGSDEISNWQIDVVDNIAK